ncbi:MAG: hypothetical protein EOO24_53640, partial [Comamonadaceae bacterium]
MPPSLPDALLLAALRDAPRRYRMPPLPADAAEARRAAPDAGLAWAIEATRRSAAPDHEVAAVFVQALAALIRKALDPQTGDPAFRALVLRARSPAVDAWVRASARDVPDRRAVHAAVDAVAHPGKLRNAPAGTATEQLAQLHALARDGDWAGLRHAAQAVPPDLPRAAQRAAVQALAAHPALLRLAEAAALRVHADVQRYLAL